uniref:Acyltransferase n=1 Tax=Steinernema glaseri TaxID=37863 RepID=A0A1I7ZUD3_9BILA
MRTSNWDLMSVASSLRICVYHTMGGFIFYHTIPKFFKPKEERIRNMIDGYWMCRRAVITPPLIDDLFDAMSRQFPSAGIKTVSHIVRTVPLN